MCTGTVAKHNIKRVWRFVRNTGVHVVDGARALVCLAAKAGGGRLFVAVDWVDIGQYKVLRAAVPLRGRSVPVLFAAYEKWKLYKSQNTFEEAFFLVMKALLPRGCEVVVLADRGFHRAALARRLQELVLGYVIRLTGSATFCSERYRGQLYELRLKCGQRRDLGFGQYCRSRPVTQRVPAYWGGSEPVPWLPATNLTWGWKQIVAAFKQRMMIEELFRDEKNIRYGWGLRQLKLSSAQRLERMLLVPAFAYMFLLLIGLISQRRFSAKHWASAVSRKRKQNSAFTIGRFMQHRVTFPVSTLLDLLTQLLTLTAKENRG
jgi:hypothetical protein